MKSHPVHGTVRSWDDESGWGVLASPEVPGEVWAHFSAVRTAEPGAFASLDPGEAVLFTWEEAEQDGYAYRAVQVRHPGAPEADWESDEGEESEGDEGDDEAFVSDLRIEFDPE
ncbi:cold-shock protein [Streptomyces sp. NPDC002851]